MKTDAKERAAIVGAAHVYHDGHSTTGWRTVMKSGCPERDPICNGIARLIADVEDAVAGLGAVGTAMSRLLDIKEESQEEFMAQWGAATLALEGERDQLAAFLNEPSDA